MSNIFNLSVEYQTLLQEIEASEGVITPELEAKLQITQEEAEQKIRAYFYIIKLFEGHINLVKEETERLADVKKVKENTIKRIKSYVNFALEAFGTIKPGQSVKSMDLGDLKLWQKKSEALELVDGLNDERFCNKSIKITCTYKGAELFNNIINTALSNMNADEKAYFMAEISIGNEEIVVDKAYLKEWLQDNEGYINHLAYPIPGINTEDQDAINEHNKMLNQITKDITVTSKASIKKNISVVFK